MDSDLPDVIDLCESDEETGTTRCERLFSCGSSYPTVFHGKNLEIDALIETVDLCDSEEETVSSTRSRSSSRSFTSDVQKNTNGVKKCDLCHRVFITAGLFSNHMLAFHHYVKCDLCDSILSRRDIYSHSKSHHLVVCDSSVSVIENHSCKLCGEKFGHLEALNAHEPIHFIEKKYSIAEQNRASIPPVKKYECSVCLKSFLSPRAFLWHKKTKHRRSKNKIRNRTLNRMRQWLGNESNHFDVRPNNVFLNSAPQLSDKQNETSELQLLSYDSPSDSRSQNKSDDCLVSYDPPGSIQSHSHEVRREEFNILETARLNSFESTNALNNNYYSITEENQSKKVRKFKCTICASSFLSKRVFKMHKKRKNCSVNDKKRKSKRHHTCHECNLHNSDKENESSPKSSHRLCACHQDEEVNLSSEGDNFCVIPNYKLFNCKICDEKFSFHYLYAKHLETHEIKKNYSCGMCEKSFASATAKNAHWLLKHFSEQVFRCTLCSKPFVNKMYLELHLKSCRKVSNASLKIRIIRKPLLKKPVAFFSCYICGRRKFRYEKQLMFHLLMAHPFQNFPSPSDSGAENSNLSCDLQEEEPGSSTFEETPKRSHEESLPLKKRRVLRF